MPNSGELELQTQIPTEEPSPVAQSRPPTDAGRADGPGKSLVLRWLLRLSRWYLQHGLFRLGKSAFWHKFCVPYLSWRDTELVCRTRSGIRMALHPREFIQNRILFFGVWEPNVTAMFESLIQPGDVVIDVGANIGYYTLLSCKKAGPGGHVYAVEPNPAVRSVLSGHLEMNGFRNYTLVPDAAWDTSSVGTLHLDRDDCGGSSLRTLEGDGDTQSVRLVRMDDVIREEHRGRVGLIKVDIEGAEAHALRGLSATLAANPRVRAVVEVNPPMLAGLGSTAEGLFAFMENLGFKPHLIPNDYHETAYLPPIRLEPPRPTGPQLVGLSYILFSRMEPW
jgi:FkbM family methyltransferase